MIGIANISNSNRHQIHINSSNKNNFGIIREESKNMNKKLY